MSLYKEYHKLPDTGRWKCKERDIKMVISFNRDSVNWATSQRQAIGYRVSVVPVQRTDKGGSIVMESFGAFTGFNDTLLEVDRQSKKRLSQAIDILHQRVDRYLLWFAEVETENV